MSYYVSCVTWLIENTRDATKFKLLADLAADFAVLFRLYQLKWVVCFFDFLLIAAAAVILLGWVSYSPENGSLRAGLAAVSCSGHLVMLLIVATKSALLAGAKRLARQLVLSCESLLPARNMSSPAT